MRIFTFIATALLFTITAVPSFAEEQRAYVGAAGGFAVGPDGTSGDVLSFAGVRIARELSVFGGVGRFQNLEPSEITPAIAETTETLSTSSGLEVIGAGKVPAWYSLAGLRLGGPMRRRVAPYAEGGVGMARLTPRASFTYSAGTLLDLSPRAGDDVTADLISLGAFSQPAPLNAWMYSMGAGADVQLDRHVLFDAGYRYSHVATDVPLHAQSVTFGLGYRF